MKQFTTPDLPYAYDALEPYIDQETMMLHHDKHHVAYTTNLNKALENKPELFEKSAEDLLRQLNSLPEAIRTAVRNHGGGHVNHSLFWEIMGTERDLRPEGKLLKAIESTFGSYESFIEKFEEAAKTQFGSGWAWLSVSGDTLTIDKSSNQDSPLTSGKTPILALDVWEHAYYLTYRNLRADYISAFWHVINWRAVERKFLQA